MNSRPLFAVLAVAGVVSFVVFALLVTGLGTTIGVEAGVLGEDPKDPELLSFETSSVHCPDDADARASNSSTLVGAGGANTEVTYARNVTLPDSSAVIGTATFERVNDSTYVLSVPFEESEDAARTCTGVVRYNGTVPSRPATTPGRSSSSTTTRRSRESRETRTAPERAPLRA